MNKHTRINSTVFAAAFDRVGLKREDYALAAAISEWMKYGGKDERIIEIIAMCRAKMPGMGLSISANNGPSSSAQTRQPDRGEEGHEQRADGGHCRSAQPLREPTDAMRRVQAEMRGTIFRSVFDTFKVGDGDDRGIGDVRFGEIDRMRKRSATVAHVLDQVQKQTPRAPHDAKIRDLIREREMQKFIDAALEANNVTA